MCDQNEKKFINKTLQKLYYKNKNKTIQSLILIIEKQQKDICELKKWIQHKKKKINVQDWLNENHQLSLSFSIWLETIHIGQKQLEYIFENGYVQGISDIIQENLPIYTKNIFPIRCFIQKPNTFYIYEKNNQWDVLSNNSFDKMIANIQFSIFKEFKIWQDSNNDLIHDEKRNHIYHKYVKKIMGGAKHKNNLLIRKKLFNYLKLNLKDIVVYNFEFTNTSL